VYSIAGGILPEIICNMKQLITAMLLALPFLGLSQYTYQHLQVTYPEPTAINNYTFENLRLYPVYAKETFKSTFKNVGKYMTLQEALTKNKVKIKEKSEGGTVNTLSIENISGDTIIVITGDVVKGGKQDRIINKDLLLSPGSGKKDLPVYCVESGRWSSGASVASNGSAAAEFKGYYNKGAMSLRKVVEKEQDQQKVWSKVDEINSNNKTSTSTKTYTAITGSADFTKKQEKYMAFFKNKFATDPNVIGVVVVSGNKVLGCDMFATHDLFAQQYQSLLHSYVTEAVVNGKSVTASAATVKAYMDKLLSDEKTQLATLKQKGNAFTEKGKKLRVSSFD
jgi:translation initiation factor 1 (eIF-1/SUI1)